MRITLRQHCAGGRLLRLWVLNVILHDAAGNNDHAASSGLSSVRSGREKTKTLGVG